MVHPNVGAVLAVDDGAGSYTSDDLERFMAARGYPLDHVRHAFLRMDGGYEAEVARALALIEGWLPEVGRRRAYSGAGRVLAPRPPMRGAPTHSPASPATPSRAGWRRRSSATAGPPTSRRPTSSSGPSPTCSRACATPRPARRFLEKVEGFKRYAENHGTSAEGNPSGGNNFRGLYNIALKSLGAARKKDPEVRLDHVIDYGQPMRPPATTSWTAPGTTSRASRGR